MGRQRKRMRVEDAFEFDFYRAKKIGDSGVYVWEKSLTGEEVWHVKFRIVHSYVYGTDTLEIMGPEDHGCDDVFAIENVPTKRMDKPYLICPGCGKWRLKLYAKSVGGQFKCRECHHLVYDQQMESNPIRHRIRHMSLEGLREKIREAAPDELWKILQIVTSDVSDVAFSEPWYRTLQRVRYEEAA